MNEPHESDKRTSDLSLYEFPSCPYCVRVLRAMAELGLAIELRDTRADPRHRADLIAGGGKSQVPCLRIQEPGGRVRWMYESLDIVAYLRERFG